MSSAQAIKGLEYIQPVLDDMQGQIVREVQRLIADNELTPELALQKWHELNALHTLPKKVLKAASAARRPK